MFRNVDHIAYDRRIHNMYDGFQKPSTYTFGNACMKLCVGVAGLTLLKSGGSGRFPEGIPEEPQDMQKHYVPEVSRKVSGGNPGRVG